MYGLSKQLLTGEKTLIVTMISLQRLLHDPESRIRHFIRSDFHSLSTLLLISSSEFFTVGIWARDILACAARGLRAAKERTSINT
jgi:hypothetical protein